MWVRRIRIAGHTTPADRTWRTRPCFQSPTRWSATWPSAATTHVCGPASLRSATVLACAGSTSCGSPTARCRSTPWAALHAITAPELAALGPPDWDKFLARQRAGCVERQRACGLDSAWLDQIPAFLDAVALDPSPRPVLLHTEVMREHLLVTPHPDGWSLSGLFDFEPAMRGAREYEFAAVGLFVSRGDAGFLRRLLTAYGYRPYQLDDALPRRLLTYALLHRYSDLRWWLEQLPPPVPTLDALAAHWWRLR